jgi:ABC-2 type transport system permease protein
MTAATGSILDLPAPAYVSTRRPSMTTYVLEAKYEFVKLLRTPHYSIPVLAFPVMFYLLFGLSFAARGKGGGGPGAAEYLLASYSIFGVVTAALFAFGAFVATERALGWLVLKRATPMPVSAYLAAKLASAMLFGTVILIMMGFCAVVLGGVHLPVSTWLKLLLVVTLGSIPFCMAGLLVAFIVPPTGAPGIMNLINLPLAFAGGLWMPVEMLPKMFRAIAPIVPQYHLGQLALSAVGAVPAGETLLHVSALAATALVFGGASWVAWRRSDASA